MPVYLPVGPQYPDIVSSPRKFRAYDEPERKADFEPFTEFHGPHIPSSKLGSPGDVYLNTKGANLYLKVQDQKWSVWEGTRQKKLAHPSYPNRFLWVYRSSIQFYPDAFIKANKIFDREVVLRSIITLLSKGSSRKRTADEALLDTYCLNTKKGIKGRLSAVENPSSVDESLPQQSISAPVRSSGNQISAIQPPSASPSRAHLSASASPPAGDDVESLKLEVERLRKALEEQRAGSALASNSQEIVSADHVQTDPVPDELVSHNIGKPQLQSPPPTPSLPDQITDFSTQNMHHDELIFDTPVRSPVRSPVLEPQSTNVVPHEAKEVTVKTEANPPPPPPIALATKSNARETIDLTGDSDDDVPPVPKSRHTLPLPRKAPSSPSYAPLAVRPVQNNAASSRVTHTTSKAKVSSAAAKGSSHTPSRVGASPAALVSGITHTPLKSKISSTAAATANQSSHTSSRVGASPAASVSGITHTPLKSKVSSTAAAVANQSSHTPSRVGASPAASVSGITHTPLQSKVPSTPALNRSSHTPSRLGTSPAAFINGITHTSLKSKVSSTPALNRSSHTPSRVGASPAAFVNGIAHTPPKPKSSSSTPAVSRSHHNPSHNEGPPPAAANVGREAYTSKSKTPPAAAAVKEEEEDDDSDIEIISGEQFEAEKKVKEKVDAIPRDTQPAVTRAAYVHQVKSEPVAQTISREDSPMHVVQPLEEAPEASVMESDASAAAVGFDDTTGAMDEDFDLDMDMDDMDLLYPDEEPLLTTADAPAPVALCGDVKMEVADVKVEAQQGIDDNVPGDLMVLDMEDEVPVNSGFTRKLIHFFFEETRDLSGLGCRLCPPRTRETLQSNATRSMGNHLLDAHENIFDPSTINMFSHMTETELYDIYPLP